VLSRSALASRSPPIENGLQQDVPIGGSAARTGCGGNTSNGLNSFQFSYDLPTDQVQVVVVAYASANLAMYDDAMWDKHRLGEVFKVQDPSTGQPATRNIWFACISRMRVSSCLGKFGGLRPSAPATTSQGPTPELAKPWPGERATESQAVSTCRRDELVASHDHKPRFDEQRDDPSRLSPVPGQPREPHRFVRHIERKADADDKHAQKPTPAHVGPW
jgi:hypothetical protein